MYIDNSLNEDNTLKEFAAISGAGYAPTPGYGLFEFTAPSSLDFNDSTCDVTNTDATVTHDDDGGRISVGMLAINGDIPPGTTVSSINSNTSFELSAAATGSATNTTIRFSDPKQYNILLTSDGDQIDALDSNGQVVGWMNFDGSGDSDTDVAPIFYAAGNGIYAADANFNNANTNICYIYVHRTDYGISGSAADLVTASWIGNQPVIDSPSTSPLPKLRSVLGKE